MGSRNKKRSFTAIALALQWPAAMAAMLGGSVADPGALQGNGHTRRIVAPVSDTQPAAGGAVVGSAPAPGPANGWYLGVCLAFIAPRPRAGKDA